ncbi:hypothetical protein Droror1_Dr00026454 [Drosera rotundifolia]
MHTTHKINTRIHNHAYYSQDQNVSVSFTIEANFVEHTFSLGEVEKPTGKGFTNLEKYNKDGMNRRSKEKGWNGIGKERKSMLFERFVRPLQDSIGDHLLF